MAALIGCQICMEEFTRSQTYIVACDSPVDHTVCFACERKWRDKCGGRMTCPTCRQQELYRTYESLQRDDIYRTYESTTSSISTSHMSTFAAQVASEMAAAVQIARDVRMRDDDALRLADYLHRERASSAVARARVPISTITPEELSVINARLMNTPTLMVSPTLAARAISTITSEDRLDFELIAGPEIAAQVWAIRPGTDVTRAIRPGTDVTPPLPTAAYVERRVRKLCASGRDCHSSSASGRSTTRLKCIHCNLVFCCRTCNECVGCRPIPSMLDMLD